LQKVLSTVFEQELAEVIAAIPNSKPAAALQRKSNRILNMGGNYIGK
jgi:hypothetical protein